MGRLKMWESQKCKDRKCGYGKYRKIAEVENVGMENARIKCMTGKYGNVEINCRTGKFDKTPEDCYICYQLLRWENDVKFLIGVFKTLLH